MHLSQEMQGRLAHSLLRDVHKRRLLLRSGLLKPIQAIQQAPVLLTKVSFPHNTVSAQAINLQTSAFQ